MVDKDFHDLLARIEHHLLVWINENKQDNWHRSTFIAWRLLDQIEYRAYNFHVQDNYSQR